MGVSLVHATDPLIFLAGAQDPAAKVVGDKQQALDEKALADMFQRIRSIPDDGQAAFLVLTGNLGLDPCLIAGTAKPTAEAVGNTKAAQQHSAPKSCTDVDPARRKDQTQHLAKLLGSSPLPDIYLVAGDRDVAREGPSESSLKYFNALIDDVQSALGSNNSGVRLHNLMRCYATDGTPPSSCYADIAGSDYRLVGLPSYSFREETRTADRDSVQTAQFDTFRGLLQQAQQANRKVVVVTSIPEIDDPLLLAQERYAAKEPPQTNAKDEKNTRSPWSTWNVGGKLLYGWRDVLASNAVAAVLAGGLSDSHKEIYRRPYAWSGIEGRGFAFRKLFLAPPLAVAGQDASPIQARGFSWVNLYPDRVASTLYWYNSEAGVFEPDPAPNRRSGHGRRASALLTPILWLWNLDTVDPPLVRFAVLVIAFLTAFLTIVALWQIPASDNPLADPKKDQSAVTPAPDPSPFTSRFGKMVIAGLGGLVFTELAKSLGNQQPSADTRWFYVVWFVVFFFASLFGLNGFRAVTEFSRARVAVTRAGGGSRLGAWSVPLITSLDTFVSLIQGKNQTMTQVFAEMIIDQQRNAIRVMDLIRKDLNLLIERVVKASVDQSAASALPSVVSGDVRDNLVHPRSASSANPPDDDRRSRVRVNISVLSADQSHLFYISRSPRSPQRPFRKDTVAWVSAVAGEPLWYKASYKENKDYFEKIVLFRNEDNRIEGEGPVLLSKHYTSRRDDYAAFVIFPLPWPPRRDIRPDFVRGAVHISFSKEADFDKIWKIPAAGPESLYPSHKQMLGEWCLSPEIRKTLWSHLELLSELLSGFNEAIYNYIEPTQKR
jgi:hypothetical protein